MERPVLHLCIPVLSSFLNMEDTGKFLFVCLFVFVFCANLSRAFLCLRGTILEESRPKNAMFS